jgi:23S rRNA (uracil1939-C5)-methyltransferase
MSTNKILEVYKELYGGLVQTSDPAIALPFVLRKETVELSPDNRILRITPAPERIKPKCPHFGKCGGCQYQIITPQQQGDVKRRILFTELDDAGIEFPVEIPAHTAEGYGYRNRIRLRVQRIDNTLRLGYNIRTTTEFLPITTCPIAAPILWSTAEAILQTADTNPDAAFWLNAATELELFCNDDLSRIQLTLLCAPRTKVQRDSLAKFFAAIQQVAPQVTSLAAIASDPRTGPTGRTLDAVGAAGLNYRVGDETYWITRGGFFQVNRFLLDKLVALVTESNDQPRIGKLAWDLYAGVGLFSRVLAKNFTRVVAVEANPTAASDNRAALRKLNPVHEAITATTLDFLRTTITQRDRPDFIVLDPPRAGAGEDACHLLLSIASPHIVYVSCDPITLARDLKILSANYRITQLHLVDLFPQTFHMETVVALERRK